MSNLPAGKAAPAVGLVAAALSVVYVVWGSTYLGIRVIVDEAPPLSAMGMRFLTAGVLLGVVLSVKRGVRRLVARPRELAGAALLALLMPTLAIGLVSVAENLGAPSGATALLIAISPLIIVTFRATGGDMPSRTSMLGLLLGFAGLCYLVLAGRGAGSGLTILTAVLIVLSSTSWAFGSFIQPRVTLPKDPFVTAVYEMVFAGLILLGTGALMGERLTGDYSAQTWLAFGYLVAFGSMLGFTAYVWLVTNAPISLVATFAYVNPVVAVFLGWLILDEAVTLPIAIGGGIVVLAVAIVISAERPRRTPPAEPAPAEPELSDAEPERLAG